MKALRFTLLTWFLAVSSITSVGAFEWQSVETSAYFQNVVQFLGNQDLHGDSELRSSTKDFAFAVTFPLNPAGVVKFEQGFNKWGGMSKSSVEFKYNAVADLPAALTNNH